MICPDCGDEVDDVGGVCPCVFAKPVAPRPNTNRKGAFRTSLGIMVRRKLEQQRKREAE